MHNIILKTAKTIAVTLLIGFGVTACVSPSQVKQRAIDSIAPDQRSFIIGRYAIECIPRKGDCNHPFNSITLFYSSDESSPPYGGSLSSNWGGIFGMYDTTYDFVSPDDKEKGYYFCEIVPAGDYYFNNFSYANYAGGGSRYSLRKEHEFKIPFTTKPGEVVYVGRFKLTTSTGRNVFRIPLPAPGVVLLSNNEAQDVPIALTKCPVELDASNVRNIHLNAVSAGQHPLVHDE